MGMDTLKSLLGNKWCRRKKPFNSEKGHKICLRIFYHTHWTFIIILLNLEATKSDTIRHMVLLLNYRDATFWRHICTVPIIFLDAAKLGIGLIFSVYNWDQPKLVCKGAYPRVIRYHLEIRPQPQISLSGGHFPQKPGFRKMAVGQRWLVNNLISFVQFVPRLWVLRIATNIWRKMQQPQNCR